MEAQTKEYNTTQLDPKTTFERHVFHRDQFAHYLRWTHVLKIAKIGMNILDFGCGTGNLLEVLYRNRYKANKYIGVDIKKSSIKNASNKFKDVKWAEFIQSDLVKDDIKFDFDFDIITSFEVAEHVGRKNVNKFLKNISKLCNEKTIVLISTPIYDEKVGAADNHIVNGIVGEMTFDEFKNELKKFFIIEDVFGTFASQTHYKKMLNKGSWQEKMFNHLTKYYDSNLVSNLMAPFYPQQSRNCLWKLKIKN